MYSFGRIFGEINVQDLRERNIRQVTDSKKNSPVKFSKGSLAQQIQEVIGKNPQKMETKNLSNKKIGNHQKKLSISSKVSKNESPKGNINYKENPRIATKNSDLNHSVLERNSSPNIVKEQKLNKIHTILNYKKFPLKEANMNQNLFIKDSLIRKNSQDDSSHNNIAKKFVMKLSPEDHMKIPELSSSEFPINPAIEDVFENPKVEELVKYFEAKLQEPDASFDNLDPINMLGLSDIAPFDYIDPQELSAVTYSSKMLSIKETGCPKQVSEKVEEKF